MIASIFFGSPVTSIVYVAGVESMTLARKISAIRKASARSSCRVWTLISAVSRETNSLSFRSTTLITSISLFSCLTICSTIRSSPDVTIVICDIEGSSVGATDRLSMLNPRPLKSPAMRDSTPNLFSTVTRIICSMLGREDGVVVLRRRLARAALLLFQLRRIFQNHFMIAAACGDHWIHVLIGMGRNVDDDRSFRRNGFLQNAVEVAHFPGA